MKIKQSYWTIGELYMKFCSKIKEFQYMNKKGMEMWQLVLMILAILLLLFAIGWYYSLSQSGSGMLDKVSNLL